MPRLRLLPTWEHIVPPIRITNIIECDLEASHGATSIGRLSSHIWRWRAVAAQVLILKVCANTSISAPTQDLFTNGSYTKLRTQTQ